MKYTLQNLKTLTPKDVRALTAFGRCGYLTLKESGLSESRMRQFIKAGLVERIVHSHPKERDVVCFRTTSRGRQFIQKHLSFCPYIPRSFAHDRTLTKRYLAISETERNTWLTEAQCCGLVAAHVRMLRKKGYQAKACDLWDKFRRGELSMPDGAYRTCEDELVLVEVTTKNYDASDIEAKIATATGLDARLDLIDA